MKMMRIGVMAALLLTLATFALAETPAPVAFTDPAVEAAIRRVLSKPEGGVTLDELSKIEEFVYDPISVTETETPGVYVKAEDLPQIQSIADLKYCANLKRLVLFEQPIRDIEALRGLMSLETINFVQCPNVTDLTPLAGKERLREVVLLEVPAADYAPVFELPNLTVFVAGGGAPDLSPLRGMSKLEKFFWRGTDAPADLTPLLSHPNMREIALSDISPEDFRTLFGSWPRLEMLEVSSSGITSDDLTAIASRDLTQIRLYDCPGIADLTPLAEQANLKSVFVYRCGVEDVSPLARIPSLTARIDLRGNPVTDLSPLQALQGLENLMVTKNGDSYTLESLQALLPNTEITIEP